jgi:hypothetical protein
MIETASTHIPLFPQSPRYPALLTWKSIYEYIHCHIGFTLPFISNIKYAVLFVVKGPAADATDAPHPWGLLCNPYDEADSFFHFFLVMQHRWNEIDRGKPKYSYKNLSQCHFIHHKSHMDWTGIESPPPRWETMVRPLNTQLPTFVTSIIFVQFKPLQYALSSFTFNCDYSLHFFVSEHLNNILYVWSLT